MDWLGGIGYMYFITSIDHLYYAEKIGIMSLPRSKLDLYGFKLTLNLVLCYRSEMLSTGDKATAALIKRNDFDHFCELVDVSGDLPAVKNHDIYFTTT